MKKTFILLCALILMAGVYAQCPQYVNIDTTICGPINVTVDASVMESRLCGDSITIVFDDSTTTLDSSRQVYFHAGPEFRPLTGFQGNYTNDQPMTKIGAHEWSIKFNPRTFFNYSPDSCLNSVAFGFRDSGFVNYVKCGSNDIFLVLNYGPNPYLSCDSDILSFSVTHSSNISYLWSDGSTSASRTFTGSTNLTVTATGVGGCTATGRVIINYLIITGDSTVCSSDSATLDAGAGFASYSWSTGATTETIRAGAAGTYSVTATTAAGCIYTASKHVNVAVSPVLNLNDTCLVTGSVIIIDAGAGFSSYLWSTGASTESIFVSHTGSYWVRVTNAGGCSASDTVIVDTCAASCKPIAHFGVLSNVNGVVTFKDSSVHGVYYSWSFGDGGSLLDTGAVTVSHTYTTSGTYTVTEIVRDSCGVDTAHLSVTVTISAQGCLPQAHFSVVSNVNGLVTLRDSSLRAQSYKWIFGDGTTLLDTGVVTVSHTYANAGSYTITEIVKDSCGSDTFKLTITVVKANAGCKPTGTFTDVNIVDNSVVTFLNTFMNGAVYYWSFGDSTSVVDTGGTGNATHSYSQNGTYTVTEIVCGSSDTCGCDTVTKSLTISGLTGINEIKGLKAVNVYPNPASNSCSIAISSATLQEVTVDIYSMLGSVVFTHVWQLTPGDNKLDVDMAGIASGLYNIILRTPSGVLTKKLDIIK